VYFFSLNKDYRVAIGNLYILMSSLEASRNSSVDYSPCPLLLESDFSVCLGFFLCIMNFVARTWQVFVNATVKTWAPQYVHVKTAPHFIPINFHKRKMAFTFRFWRIGWLATLPPRLELLKLKGKEISICRFY